MESPESTLIFENQVIESESTIPAEPFELVAATESTELAEPAAAEPMEPATGATELTRLPASVGLQREIARNEAIAARAERVADEMGLIVKEVSYEVVVEQFPELCELLLSSTEYQSAAASGSDSQPEVIFRLHYLPADDVAADTGDTLTLAEIIIRLPEPLSPIDQVEERADDQTAERVIESSDFTDDLLTEETAVSASYSARYQLTSSGLVMHTEAGETYVLSAAAAGVDGAAQVQRQYDLYAELVEEGEGATRRAESAMEQIGDGEPTFTWQTTVYTLRGGEMVAEVMLETYSLDQLIAQLENGSPALVWGQGGEPLALADLYQRRLLKEEVLVKEEELVAEATPAIADEGEDGEDGEDGKDEEVDGGARPEKVITQPPRVEIIVVEDIQTTVYDRFNHERVFFQDDEEADVPRLAVELFDDGEGVEIVATRPFTAAELPLVLESRPTNKSVLGADWLVEPALTGQAALLVEPLLAKPELASEMPAAVASADEELAVAAPADEMLADRQMPAEIQAAKPKSTIEVAAVTQAGAEAVLTAAKQKKSSLVNNQARPEPMTTVIRVEKSSGQTQPAGRAKDAERAKVAERIHQLTFTERVRDRTTTPHRAPTESVVEVVADRLNDEVNDGAELRGARSAKGEERRVTEKVIAQPATVITKKRVTHHRQVVRHGQKMSAGNGGWQIRTGEGGVRLYTVLGAPAHLVGQALLAAQAHSANHPAAVSKQYFLQEAAGGYELVCEDETVTTVTEQTSYARAA